MGHVNENAVFCLGVLVERITSEASLQGAAYAGERDPDVCGTGGFIRLSPGCARSGPATL
jgi:hypothetical protein